MEGLKGEMEEVSEKYDRMTLKYRDKVKEIEDIQLGMEEKFANEKQAM